MSTQYNNEDLGSRNKTNHESNKLNHAGAKAKIIGRQGAEAPQQYYSLNLYSSFISLEMFVASYENIMQCVGR